MALHYRFFIAGIIFVLIGMILGMWMGMAEDHTFTPVHAHLNLLGWATMFLFGLYYRGNESAEAGALPQIQFWCSVVGLILLALGIGASTVQSPWVWLTIPGSVLSLVAMLIFLVVVVRSSGRPRVASM
jgi:hypothetical protein